MPEPPDALVAHLGIARARGWIGPGADAETLAHSARFVAAWVALLPDHPPRRALDLGSGGGLPGLVLAATVWPTTEWTLLDASTSRCTALTDAVEVLGLRGRVEVVHGRAEDVAREQRGQYDLVTARSFGPPAVTAECGLPFLVVGGLLLVSEPPTGGGTKRWPSEGLTDLGGELAGVHDGIAALRVVAAANERYPRRAGMPAKRPLF